MYTSGDDSSFLSYKEWCQTIPMKMPVRVKGCKTRMINNNYCMGQCNSYYLPSGVKDNEFDGGKPTIHCTNCVPVQKRWKKVTVYCPGRKYHPIKKRKIEYIEKCQCVKVILEPKYKDSMPVRLKEPGCSFMNNPYNRKYIQENFKVRVEYKHP